MPESEVLCLLRSWDKLNMKMGELYRVSKNVVTKRNVPVCVSSLHESNGVEGCP